MRVYFDMDGVLADWTGGVARLFDADPAEVRERLSEGAPIHKALGVSSNATWRAIDKAGGEFWASLEVIPGAIELWHSLRDSGVTCRVLTSPSWDPTSLAGKLRWMQTHLGDRRFRDYFIGPHKHELAGPGRLLLDDREKLVREFREAGGSAVLYPAPGNGATVTALEACHAVRRWVGVA